VETLKVRTHAKQLEDCYRTDRAAAAARKPRSQQEARGCAEKNFEAGTMPNAFRSKKGHSKFQGSAGELLFQGAQAKGRSLDHDGNTPYQAENI